MPSVSVRLYRPEDRKTLREICCNTGYLGTPVDPLFEDRELFADYLTKYYTDYEPGSAVILEEDGLIKGYMIGCRFPKRQKAFDRWNNLSLAFRGICRYFTRYNEASKKFVRWVISQGRKQTPYTPHDMPHFHINLLPDARSVRSTHALIEFFLKILVDAGETHVYGQMVVFENRRGPRMFARYGFEVVDKVEVTKYRDLTDKPVYLYTVVKDLKKNPHLYGTDLWSEKDSPKEA